MQIVEGKSQGSYAAVFVVLNLAEGRDKAYISKVSFCTLDEIDRIERAFEQGGVEAIIQFKL
jgi:hypothetical protein